MLNNDYDDIHDDELFVESLQSLQNLIKGFKTLYKQRELLKQEVLELEMDIQVLKNQILELEEDF